MSSISQHISPDLIRLERTSIIYDVTDIVFSLKQHIPPPGGLLLAEVSLVLHRSHGQSKYAVYLPTRRRMNRSSTFMESWRFCPTAFLLRSGECLPRHLVRIHFSRYARGCFASHPLFLTFLRFHNREFQKFFLSFSRIAFFLLLTACWVIFSLFASCNSVSGLFDKNSSNTMAYSADERCYSASRNILISMDFIASASTSTDSSAMV